MEVLKHGWTSSTPVYEVIPNGIYDDDEVDTLTIELFTDADYVVTVTNSQVPVRSINSP